MKPRRTHRSVPFWLPIATLVVTGLFALLGPVAIAQPVTPTATADAGADGDAGSAGVTPAPKQSGGLHTMSDGSPVPSKWMPPGTSASPLPSEEIFPPQQLTVRFNHKLHVQGVKLTCKACHAGAYASDEASDSVLPDPKQTCDGCHDVDHSDLSAVKAGKDESAQCGFCHLGDHAGASGQVAALVIPKPNLRFSHKKHLTRNIQCAQCHGQVGELELATREQLPRMAGCFACHNMSGAAEGEAKGTCTNCHLTRPDGRLEQTFSTGMLVPPRWLHLADHNPDWIERHKTIAADDSAFCSNCHSNQYCTDCHDGKVRPRKVHPNDWLSMHPEAARQDNPRCTSCHQEQTFCADCHRRTGVARDTASGNRLAGRRFHPPPAEWTTAPRGPNHHAWEAERNMNACVSCHTERDCATCHATRGLSGGQGVNPHPSGFTGKCKTAFARNPRPCLVCHQSNDAFVRACR